MAIGAEVHIDTMPGHLPLVCNATLNELLVENAKEAFPSVKIINAGHFSASTDMGDVSHLMPAIHPFYLGERTGSFTAPISRLSTLTRQRFCLARLLPVWSLIFWRTMPEKAKALLDHYETHPHQGCLHQETGQLFQRGGTMKNIKLHVCVMLMIVIAELIGVKSFSVGPGKIVLLPMLYALIIGIFTTPRFLIL